MLAATALFHTACLHSVIVAGPPCGLSDRIALVLRANGLVVLRTRRIDAGTCVALGGATGYAIVVVAQTSEVATESCHFASVAPPAPVMRVTAGRLTSVTCPSGDLPLLAEALAGAGVAMSPAMMRALDAAA